MQVGPDSFGVHSTRPQLFWKQWNRIRHKSVLMVGSVLWKGFFSFFLRACFPVAGREVLSVHCKQSCCQDSWLPCSETRPGSSALSPPCANPNSGNLNKTNVRQVSTWNHKGRNVFWKAAFINNLCISKLFADVCGRFFYAKFYSKFGESSFAPKSFKKYLDFFFQNRR